ncbi:MobP2 family relaxase [Bacillus velezensis]
MTIKNAGVVHVGRFLTSKQASKISGGFKGYVNYVSRKEAVKNLDNGFFSEYHDYMKDELKSNGLFTSELDKASDEDKEKLKSLFDVAEKNKSVLWQDVFSFRNEWLEKHNVYDSQTGALDEQKLKNATRASMNVMLKKEKMEESAIWVGAIHLNTDNIHVHVATVELTPTRKLMPNGEYRGKIKPKTYEAMKSKMGNFIMDRSKERSMLDELIRKKIIKEKEKISLAKDKETKSLFIKVLNELPENKRYWQYSYEQISHLRPNIDEISRRYVIKYHGKEFDEVCKRLDEEVKVMREAFGDAKKTQYEGYKQNKINDLYKRLGNAVLKEMKNHAYQRERIEFAGGRRQIQKRINKKIQTRIKPDSYNAFRNNMATLNALKQMQKNMDKSYEKWKSEKAFERLHGIKQIHEYEIGD